MSNMFDILNNVPEAKPVRAFLPIKGNQDRYRVQGIYRKIEPPRFSLLFQPGVLPTEQLDKGQNCIISIDMGGPNISLEALISSVSGQALYMIVQKQIDHEQIREFFRVDAATQVIGKSFHPEFFGAQGAPRAIRGRTIDISGSGILAVFSEKPPTFQKIRLELSIPTKLPEIIKIIAHPVRTLQVNDHQWEVAYHFDDISIEDRDKIIGCCLVIQRRLLRLKAHFRDSTK